MQEYAALLENSFTLGYLNEPCKANRFEWKRRGEFEIARVEWHVFRV